MLPLVVPPIASVAIVPRPTAPMVMPSCTSLEVLTVHPLAVLLHGAVNVGPWREPITALVCGAPNLAAADVCNPSSSPTPRSSTSQAAR
jgi:hypothetical protein